MTSNSPVILQVIPELGPGGAETGCIDMAAAIMRAGGKAIVVSNGGPRVHELERSGAVHYKMPVHSKNPLIMMQNVTRLKKIIKDENIDIIHARSRAPAWSCYKACKGENVKFMTTCHAPYNISGNAKRFYNSSIARGERVIAISHYVADYLRHHYRLTDSVIRIVHRGISLDKFHPTAVTAERMIKISQEWRLPDGASLVMLPGRLTRWKGHHVLIKAMAKLNRKDVFCVIIGSDQGRTGYRLELEETIREHKLEGQVRIVDHCDDMPAAYMMATVVVSASTDPEGFGRIPVEAQAMGRPIIATDHGGAQETIKRGETGWLIPHSDPLALSKALGEALSLDANQRAILATRSMAHIAEHFTKELMAHNTLNIYGELLAEKYSGGATLQDNAATGPLNLKAAE